MSILDDVDPDRLIARLAGPLAPDVRPAFRRAAEDALAQIPCPGEGAFYRALVLLQRNYFDPPSDGRAGWDISCESRTSKLRAARPIWHGRDQRYTRQFKPTG